jgi:Chromo (CHRromatin Organisation MOdifier) domain/Integrase zinc binding domain
MGINKTKELLARKFHWENLSADVRKYVEGCPQCNGSRVPRHKPYGQLQSLPLPEHPWQEISMDFITGLPMSSNRQGERLDAILVVVDRFTKAALFIPTEKTLTAPGLAALLYELVECRYGTPEGIVGDRDKLFTSTFWKEYSEQLAMKRRLSTAYHPQTDGQTERVHQTIEHYLRSFAAQSHTWAPLLPEAQFAYNNSFHSTIGTSPNHALYGYHPRVVDGPPSDESKVQGVRERIRHVSEIRSRARDCWKRATESQTRYYNRRHQEKEYDRGQIVGLSTKNFRFKDGHKLAPTYIRVRILERVGKQAYKVALPTKYAKIHNVFPVAMIEPWIDRNGIADTLPLPDLIEDNEEWEVEDLLDHTGEGSLRRYLVKWAGWPVEYNTWEPIENLTHCQQLLDRYHKRRTKTHRKWDEYRLVI